MAATIEVMDRPRPLANSYWVIPGRLLAGEYPTGGEEMDGKTRVARLEQLRKAGINYFVDLTTANEQPAYSGVLPRRAHYLRSPIHDTEVPQSVAQVQKIIGDIRAALDFGHGVYVHCRAGIGRTGLVIGCFLAEELGDGKGALKELNRLWQQSERSKTWPKVPQTAEQADYIREWLMIGRRN